MRPSSGSLGVVVVAAGSSRRFGTDKLFVRLGPELVLERVLRTLESTASIAAVSLVLSAANLERGRRLVERGHFAKVTHLVTGGARRQDSVWNGLQPLRDHGWVAVHDGARPFATSDLFERGYQAAQATGAAIAAVPVKDTIKIASDGQTVDASPPRAMLWAAQTPQFARTSDLLEAYARCGAADATDEAEILQRAGVLVAIFPGTYDNLKITTAEDLWMARAITRQTRLASRNLP